MFNNPMYSDVMIRQTHEGSTKEYYAHKAVLSAGSPWFFDLLTNVHNGEDAIDIPGDDPELFEVALRFLYTHQLEKSVLDRPAAADPNPPPGFPVHLGFKLRVQRQLSNLLALHSLADKYEVSGLQVCLTQYMPGSEELYEWVFSFLGHNVPQGYYAHLHGPHTYFPANIQQFVQQHYRTCFDKNCGMGRRVCSAIVKHCHSHILKGKILEDLVVQWPRFGSDMFLATRENDGMLWRKDT
ncbi:hypothetical protein BU23DRAFT_604351 [Bimuria novae-zelandiae CBS 107.79]|uniref:BTB domain-containing protein n=1 Tax=Bimuria novae-zelandiae CBS 107.79 TaxID=1447943 RepID=A0A6A5UQI0_9PLEO|nr:hypothetical protein BU23DRAFT_604351 [Bimuria novae-zelandiae CBS 107.79]